MSLSDILFETHETITAWIGENATVWYTPYQLRKIRELLNSLDGLRAVLDTPPRPDGVDEVPIADVLVQDMELRPQGKGLVGCCPIHLENTPSFIVLPEENRYHCLGCQQGGDSVDFRMRLHGETFDQAVAFVRSLSATQY